MNRLFSGTQAGGKQARNRNMKEDMNMEMNRELDQITDQELEQIYGGVKFKYFAIEKCFDCGEWEFMLCNRQWKECPKCHSKNFGRVFGI